MKKGEIYEGIVDDFDFPNKGILLIDGEKVSVKNALPGQEIRFAEGKNRRTVIGGEKEVAFGEDRRGVPSFWRLRRMLVSKLSL